MKREDREPLIQRYAEGTRRLKEALAKAPEAMRKWRPKPGDFSVHEVVVHCADSEVNSHSRIRYLMTEDHATIQGYDTDVWAEAFDYQNHPLDEALLAVEAVRANTVPMLRRAPESAWESAGTHTESGPYTADDWLRIYAAHCHEHADQIEGVVNAWKAAGEPVS